MTLELLCYCSFIFIRVFFIITEYKHPHCSDIFTQSFVGFSCVWCLCEKKMSENQNRLNDPSHHSFCDIERFHRFTTIVCLFHSFIQWLSFLFCKYSVQHLQYIRFAFYGWKNYQANDNNVDNDDNDGALYKKCAHSRKS